MRRGSSVCALVATAAAALALSASTFCALHQFLWTVPRPGFVRERPYSTSSYYASTTDIETLLAVEREQVRRDAEAERLRGSGGDDEPRWAVVVPFCEFDAEALPYTILPDWSIMPPCKAAAETGDGGTSDYEDGSGPSGEGEAEWWSRRLEWRRRFYDLIGRRKVAEADEGGGDDPSPGAARDAKVDLFLFYSQNYSADLENGKYSGVVTKAVDSIMRNFYQSNAGWSQCFDNVYAIEANIPQEQDLYITSAMTELYNWINGPNRQFESAYRIVQSGEWGDYEGFFLMEQDARPIRPLWLDAVWSEIEANRPFATLGSRYNGDHWDPIYEHVPVSAIRTTNGNAIYNTSHPLLERLVSQLEVEAPSPYNSVPYDTRLSQMWTEGILGEVPELAPKMLLTCTDPDDEEDWCYVENITLPNNTGMFKKWADEFKEDRPFKYTSVIQNYQATNVLPHHIGDEEYIVHGAMLNAPYNSSMANITLVVSEWEPSQSSRLIEGLDLADHPFSVVVVMTPPGNESFHRYANMTSVPVRMQTRRKSDSMDLCEVEIDTPWFMMTNAYHRVAKRVDLMFEPVTFRPVIPYTWAVWPTCFQYPRCKKTVHAAQLINPKQHKVVGDMDMLYDTKTRNTFCEEWKTENGGEGEHLHAHFFKDESDDDDDDDDDEWIGGGPHGPTGTSYLAWLTKNRLEYSIYSLSDRSIMGLRLPFVSIVTKDETPNGMSAEELAKRVDVYIPPLDLGPMFAGKTYFTNQLSNCRLFETEKDCVGSGLGCTWRPLFDSCYKQHENSQPFSGMKSPDAALRSDTSIEDLHQQQPREELQTSKMSNSPEATQEHLRAVLPQSAVVS